MGIRDGSYFFHIHQSDASGVIRQGDVGALPFDEESFDIMLSMNGFQTFPDMEAAYKETFHVLKPGGIFRGFFYVEGGCNWTV